MKTIMRLDEVSDEQFNTIRLRSSSSQTNNVYGFIETLYYLEGLLIGIVLVDEDENSVVWYSVSRPLE